MRRGSQRLWLARRTPGRAASTASTTSTAEARPFFQRLGIEPFDLCRALYGTFKAGKEPAAALVGNLAERGIL